jgi:hypothetical protein
VIKQSAHVSPFQGFGELGLRRTQGASAPRVALRSTLGYLIMPRWGEDHANGAQLMQFSCIAGSDDLFDHNWAQG